MSYLRSIAKNNAHIKRLYMKYRDFISRDHKYFDWRGLLEGDRFFAEALGKSKNGQRVLMATSTGSHKTALNIEALLAVALTLRGAEVHALLCDGVLSGCLQCEIGLCTNLKSFVKKGPQDYFCKGCFKPAWELYSSIGIKVHSYSENITPAEIDETCELSASVPFDEIEFFKHNGLEVGEHALAGALRFFARSTLRGEPYAEPVLRRYLKSSLITARVLKNLHQRFSFDKAVFHHGIYVPHGIVGEVCRREDIGVVNWNVGYRKGTFLFSHGDTYHHTMRDEPTDNWEHIHWNVQIEDKLLSYSQGRMKGSRDWHIFLEDPDDDLTLTGIDFSKPLVTLLTNVCWDAQLHYPANAFKDMTDWILSTIKYFQGRPDLQLAVRIHPAEITGDIPSRQRVDDEIRSEFATLPRNVFIIAPESHASTYALSEMSNAVIIYGTKTGVELTSMGIPVIVAGEAWIRNKGITIDASSLKEYFAKLDSLPLREKMPPDQVVRAKKYAYHFFFRRMIPLDFLDPTPGKWPPYRICIHSINQLMPSEKTGLDIICKGILDGSDFIYDDDNVTNVVRMQLT